MDYTTLAYAKAVLGNVETADDDLLGKAITAASRFLDHHCTGVFHSEADNYFELDDVADEEIRGQIDRQGRLLCHPHKSNVNSVAALAYRLSPRHDWESVELDLIEIDGGQVLAWTQFIGRGQVRIKISYNGGLADDPDNLPADLREIANVLAVRFYREDKAGLSDAIGVAELGTLFYTKALPPRVVKMINTYMRVVPW